jgi:hypothetical protein
MTLPQGFKTFTDGTVLTADEINGYLQQGILVFDDASARTTALTGNLREGMYSYLKSDNTTYVYDGTAWQRVGKQDVETEKNFQAFTGSGGTTVPAWATKMYYAIVGGGASGANPSNNTSVAGGRGGQVVQGNTAVTGSTSITITVGGTNASSSVAISGGSTFTATGASSNQGATGGSNGTSLSAPFSGIYGGGGASSEFQTSYFNTGFAASFCGNAGMGGGGSVQTFGAEANGRAGDTNSGGGGGSGRTSQGTGASGRVFLYFS